MNTVALARNAMASRFEVILHGNNERLLRAAGEEALSEIERIEAQLSIYRPSSEIAHVNARAAHEPVPVSAPVFSLLLHARKLWSETGGTFDVASGPIIRAWGFMGGEPKRPSAAELEDLRKISGMAHVELDDANRTVRFHKAGMMLDLGAIGKGYAIEQAVELLREAGVESALLHGGTSTVFGLGAPPDLPAWRIGIENPQHTLEAAAPAGTIVRLQTRAAQATPAPRTSPIQQLELRDEALSVSSPGGRFFRFGEELFGHVIDPRTGMPATGASFAAVVSPSATESDALSTALLVLGPQGAEKIKALRSGLRVWVA